MAAIPYAWQSMYRQAASGGRGSYSYADPSVFGVRELRSALALETGPNPNRIVVPGRGGGAKALTAMPYGSHAPGFNPSGLVVVRLTRVQ